MFHCPGASGSISLPQTEVESVPIDQVGASREISSQLESGILLRKTGSSAPTGFGGLHPLLRGTTLSVTAAAHTHLPVKNLPQRNWGATGKDWQNTLTREPKISRSIPVIGLNLRNTDDGRLMSARNLYKSSSLRRSPSCWVLGRKPLST